MKVDQKRRWKILLVAGAAVALVAGMASTVPSAYAGGTIKADDDHWISVGMGIRTSFNAQERGAPNGDAYSNTFNINNARIYINGQVHKYIKFTFNTECFNCSVGGGSGFAGNQNIGLIDAIGKVEYNQFVNFWVGRTLVPTERGELNGPFYHPTFDGFRTPFFPNDNNNGNNAGTFGRDNGVVFFGRVDPGFGHLQYVASVFSGLQSGGSGCNVSPSDVAQDVLNPGPNRVVYSGACGPNQGDSLMYAGRLTYNLLGDEFSHENPGYYTAGTYYGGYGDLLAIAVGGAHQKDGVGTFARPEDYTGLVSDLLFEKLLGNNGDAGVFTLNAEFKRMWAQNLANTLAGGACFCQFSGSSEYVTLLYLMPNKIGWGQFQPYGRFTSIQPLHNSPKREEWEAGLNYIISGFNARLSLYYRNGDIETKGFVGPGVFSPGVTGPKVDSVHFGVQIQY
jgi:hypothetical protein